MALVLYRLLDQCFAEPRLHAGSRRSATDFRPVALPEPRRVLVRRLPSAAPFSGAAFAPVASPRGRGSRLFAGWWRPKAGHPALTFRGLLDTPSTLLPSEPRMLSQYPLSGVTVLGPISGQSSGEGCEPPASNPMPTKRPDVGRLTGST